MADVLVTATGARVNEKLVDLGDGSHARQVTTTVAPSGLDSYSIDFTGTGYSDALPILAGRETICWGEFDGVGTVTIEWAPGPDHDAWKTLYDVTTALSFTSSFTVPVRFDVADVQIRFNCSAWSSGTIAVGADR
jgi:hypothetical protein